jgi:hypothetical protein
VHRHCLFINLIGSRGGGRCVESNPRSRLSGCPLKRDGHSSTAQVSGTTCFVGTRGQSRIRGSCVPGIAGHRQVSVHAPVYAPVQAPVQAPVAVSCTPLVYTLARFCLSFAYLSSMPDSNEKWPYDEAWRYPAPPLSKRGPSCFPFFCTSPPSAVGQESVIVIGLSHHSSGLRRLGAGAKTRRSGLLL